MAAKCKFSLKSQDHLNVIYDRIEDIFNDIINIFNSTDSLSLKALTSRERIMTGLRDLVTTEYNGSQAFQKPKNNNDPFYVKVLEVIDELLNDPMYSSAFYLFDGINVVETIKGQLKIVHQPEPDSESFLSREGVATSPASVKNDFWRNIFGVNTDVKNYVKSQINRRLIQAFSIDRFTKTIANPANLHQKVVELLLKYWEDIINYLNHSNLREVYLNIKRENSIDNVLKLYDTDGSPTGVYEKLMNNSALGLSLSRFATPEHIKSIYDNYVNDSNEDNTRAMKALIAITALNHFDSLVTLALEKSVVISSDFNILSGDKSKYRISDQGDANNTSWREDDDVSAVAEVSSFTKRLIETTPLLNWKKGTQEGEHYLRFTDFVNIIAKIKELSYNPNYNLKFGYVHRGQEMIENIEVFLQLGFYFSPTTQRLMREAGSLTGMIARCRLDSQLYLPAVVEVLCATNDKGQRLIDTTFLLSVTESVNLKSLFNESEKNVLYSIHKGITEYVTTDDYEELVNNSLNAIDTYNNGTNYFASICQVADSLFRVTHIEYFEDEDTGVIKLRALRDKGEDTKARMFKFQVKERNSKNLSEINLSKQLLKYLAQLDGILCSENEKEFVKKLKNEKQIQFVLNITDGVSVKVSVGITSNECKIDVLEGGNSRYFNNGVPTIDFYKSNIFYEFIKDKLGIQLDTSKGADTDFIKAMNEGEGVTDKENQISNRKTLLDLAAITFLNLIVSNKVLPAADLKKEATNFYGSEYMPYLASSEITMFSKKDTPKILKVAHWKYLASRATDTGTVKGADGESYSSAGLSRLIDGLPIQWELQNKKENSATKGCSLISGDFYRGCHVALDYKGKTNSKNHTKFTTSEGSLAIFVHDFIGGLTSQNSYDRSPYKNGTVGLLSSVNSDKSQITRIAIDLVLKLACNNKLKEVFGDEFDENSTVFDILKHPNARQILFRAIQFELGSIYSKMQANIKLDLNTLFAYIADNNLADLSNIELTDDIYTKFNKIGGLSVLESALALYNSEHRQNPLTITLEVHYVGKGTKLSENRTLVDLLDRYNNIERFEEFIKIKEAEILKSLCDADFELILDENSDAHKILLGKDKNTEGMIDNPLDWVSDSGELVLAKVTIDGKVHNIYNSYSFKLVEDKIRKFRNKGVKWSLSKDILSVNQEEGFELNPLLSKYNLIDYLFTLEFMISAVGSHIAHPAKGDFNKIEITRTSGFIKSGNYKSLPMIDGRVKNPSEMSEEELKDFQTLSTYSGKYFKSRLPNNGYKILEDKGKIKISIDGITNTEEGLIFNVRTYDYNSNVSTTLELKSNGVRPLIRNAGLTDWTVADGLLSRFFSLMEIPQLREVSGMDFDTCRNLYEKYGIRTKIGDNVYEFKDRMQIAMQIAAQRGGMILENSSSVNSPNALTNAEYFLGEDLKLTSGTNNLIKDSHQNILVLRTDTTKPVSKDTQNLILETVDSESTLLVEGSDTILLEYLNQLSQQNDNVVYKVYGRVDFKVPENFKESVQVKSEAKYDPYAEEAARFYALHKRNVSYTASMLEFKLNDIQGIPDLYNIAIMRDIVQNVCSFVGIDDDHKPYDGATFVNPFVVYLENYSLRGARAGIDKKQFVHFYNEALGHGGIIKTAGFGVTNDRIRNSHDFYKVMMYNMTHYKWLNLNGQDWVVDFTSNNQRRTTEESTYFNDIYFQRGDKFYKRVLGDCVGPNTYTYLEFQVDEQGTEIEGTQTEGEVLLNSNYSLWEFFGGEFSCKLNGEDMLEYDDSSIERVVALMNDFGEGSGTTQSTFYQPMKHSDIHYMPTEGAVKQGMANFNDSNMFFDKDGEKGNRLNFFRIKMLQAGILLDKQHHADESELSMMTLVISACAALGYTPQYAMNMYNALKSLTLNGIKNLRQGWLELFDTGNTENFEEAVAEVVMQGILKSQEREGDMLQIISSEISKAVENGTLSYKNDTIPYSHSSISNRLTALVASSLTNKGIKVKMKGILSVLCPTLQAFKLYGGRKLESFQRSYDESTEKLDLDNNPIEDSGEFTPNAALNHLQNVYSAKSIIGQSRYAEDNECSYVYNSNGSISIYLKGKEDLGCITVNNSLGNKDYIVDTVGDLPQELLDILMSKYAQFELSGDSLVGPVHFGGFVGINGLADLELGHTYTITTSQGSKNYLIDTFKSLDLFTELVNLNINDPSFSVAEWIKDGTDLDHYNVRFEVDGIEGRNRFSIADLDSVRNNFKIKDLNKIYNKSLDNAEALTNAVSNIAKFVFDKLGGTAYLERIASKFPEYDILGYEDAGSLALFLYNHSDVTTSLLQDALKYLNHVLQEELKAISPSRKEDVYATVNGQRVRVNKESIKIKAYQAIMPKIFATEFGLRKYDNLLDIKNDVDFFTKRLQESMTTRIANNKAYDVVLKSINGNHTYLKSIQDLDRSQVKARTKKIHIHTDENTGKVYQVEMNGDVIRELSSENDLILVDGLGNEIIVTGNLGFYIDNSSYNSIELSPETELMYDIVDLIAGSDNKAARNWVKYLNRFEGLILESKLDVYNEIIRNNPYDPRILEYITELGREIHTSFLKSLEIVASRIPAQSMQSFMSMEVVAFDNPDINTAYVSLMQFYMLGSDLDIDAVSLAAFEMNKNGLFVGWSNLFDLSSKEALDISCKLPFPTSVELQPTSEGEPFLHKYTNLLKHIYNVDRKIRRDKNRDLVYELVPTITVPTEYLEEFGQLINEINQKGFIVNKATVNLMAENGLYDNTDGTNTIDKPANLLQELLRVVNKHNNYFSGKSKVFVEKAIKNYNMQLMRDTINDPVNIILAQNPIDVATTPFKKLANSSDDAEELKTFTPGNVFNKIQAIVENLVGKEDVGISATALKQFFATTATLNDILENGTLEERDALWFDVKVGRNHYHTFANIKARLRRELDTIQELLDSVEEGSDAAVDLAAMLSLSVDNAKDLCLSKINAGTGMMGMYLYGLSIGVPFRELYDVINSPVGRLIAKLMNGNIFTGQASMSLQSALDYLRVGPKKQLSLYLTSEYSLGSYIEKALIYSNYWKLPSTFPALKEGESDKDFENRKKKYNEIKAHNEAVDAAVKSGNFSKLGNGALSLYHMKDGVGSRFEVGEDFKLHLIMEAISRHKTILSDKIEFINKMQNMLLKDENKANLKFKTNLRMFEFMKKWLTEADQVNGYYKSGSELKHNSGYWKYKDLETLAAGAEATKLLGQILSSNKGVKTSYTELLGQIGNVELAYIKCALVQENLRHRAVPWIPKVYVSQAHKIDFSKFITPKTDRKGHVIRDNRGREVLSDYALQLINKFQKLVRPDNTDENGEPLPFSKTKNAVTAVNILNVIARCPQFNGYLLTVQMTYEGLKSKSAKFRSIESLSLRAFELLNVHGKDNEEKVRNNIANLVDRKLINLWLLSQPMIKLGREKGDEFVKYNYELDENGGEKLSQSLVTTLSLRLGTPEANATFKRYIEEQYIPALKQAFPQNKFLLALDYITYGKTATRNPILAMSLPINMSPKEDTVEEDIFVEYKDSFNQLNSKTLNNSGLGAAVDKMSIHNMLYYYTLITFGGKTGESSLTSIFQDLSDQGACRDFSDFITKFDQSGQAFYPSEKVNGVEVNGNISDKELVLACALVGVWGDNGNIVWDKNPDTGTFIPLKKGKKTVKLNADEAAGLSPEQIELSESALKRLKARTNYYEPYDMGAPIDLVHFTDLALKGAVIALRVKMGNTQGITEIELTKNGDNYTATIKSIVLDEDLVIDGKTIKAKEVSKKLKGCTLPIKINLKTNEVSISRNAVESIIKQDLNCS